VAAVSAFVAQFDSGWTSWPSLNTINYSNIVGSVAALWATVAMRRTALQLAINSGASINPSASSLYSYAGGSSLIVYATVSDIAVTNYSGGYGRTSKVVSTGSLQCNLATVGANGLDSGTLQANTWYGLYVIHNPTTNTTALLASLGGPTLPSGYTYYSRMGSFRTDGTANKYPLAYMQHGRVFQYLLQGNLASGYPVMGSGVGTTLGTIGASSSTLAAVAIGTFVPPGYATKIKVTLFGYSTGSGIGCINPDSGCTAGYSNNVNQAMYSIWFGAGSWSIGGDMMITNGNYIYAAISNTTWSLRCFGWEENQI
jgi:hypothetical protein